MNRAYYNEFDPGAAAWLRELIDAGLIAAGDVDTRSIKDVTPDDVRGYTQCHFFAGIGGWSVALRLADWPDERPVWTGSCPCQPYSAAGKGLGDADPRNLWPDFFRLIRECRPVVVFGEQVESAIAHGWLDGVSADLEGEAYTVGAVVLGAHSVSAPHIRQRLWWVADSGRERSGPGRGSRRWLEAEQWGESVVNDQSHGGLGRLADDLRRIEREMTPGPWWRERVRAEHRPDESPERLPYLVKYRYDDVPTWLAESSCHENSAANIGGICTLRTSLPALIARLESDAGEIARLKRVETLAARVMSECSITTYSDSGNELVDALAAALKEPE